MLLLKFQIQPDREHPVRPRAARKLSKTIPLEAMSGLRPLADRMSAIRGDNYSVIAR
jgi:hypothetical protein